MYILLYKLAIAKFLTWIEQNDIPDTKTKQ